MNERGPSVISHREAQLTYYPILKCGHTALTQYLLRTGFEPYIGPYYPFAVVRHPFDRYVSALYQAFTKLHSDSWGLFLADTASYISAYDEPWIPPEDHHFYSQSSFLPEGSVDLFRISDIDELPGYLHDNGVPDPYTEQIVVKGPTPPEAKKLGLEALEPVEEVISGYYYSDLQLFDSI